jgi:hypothetical protein
MRQRCGEWTRRRTAGARLRRMRRPARRALIGLCVQDVLEIDSSDHTADLRQVQRSDRTTEPIPNP